MTPAEFDTRAAAHRITGRTREALRLVYVDGLTAYAAAQRIGINQAVLSRARKRFDRPLCPHCGQAM